uniref:Dynein light chain n=1 Tax=Strombidium rassoulzadegani TaxID=1082188 RepID=A0A7S3CL93_9SPIT|mmetsp:Transcript_15320/g.25882  ORF Transcript_15320/g.25882 Transcript_15320/m.25882 type:complete len:112 (+) Transcript_15320:37-372(+)
MSDEESDNQKAKVVEPMPEYKIRFTDMPDSLVEKAVRLTAKMNEGQRLDKEVATAIHRALKDDPDLGDECAGWHVLAGKSYASAITYQTKNVIFFDLLGEVHKTFLLFKTQ